MKGESLAGVLFTAGLLVLPVYAEDHLPAAGSTIPRPLASAEGRVSVLVEIAPTAERPEGLERDRDRVREFATAVGARVKYEYRILPNVLNLRDVPRVELERLRGMPGVVRVEEDEPVHGTLNQGSPLINAYPPTLTGAGLVVTGRDVRICVLGSGVDSDHVMFGDRIDTAAGFDFLNNDADPEDDNGHETHIAGIAAGTGPFFFGLGECVGSAVVVGVAPEATIIAVKILDENLNGTTSDTIAGIDWCASPSLPGGPADVINMSFGNGSVISNTNCDGQVVAQAANNAVAQGIVAVAASGNDGSTTGIGSPACASQVISVGSLWDDDYPNCEFPTAGPQTAETVVASSNQGDNLDVTAPGCAIFSAVNDPGGVFFNYKCGTSMAAPFASGLATLLLEVDPDATPAEVRQWMQNGAADLGPAGPDAAYGYGRVDALASLQLVVPPSDSNEPNDSSAEATVISCPAYRSVAATIERLGDVDYFVLTGPAGSIVSLDIDASRWGSSLDPTLGVFDSSLALIAANDDGSAPEDDRGSLDSFQPVVLPADGLVYVAVSSSPDLDFDGITAVTTGAYRLEAACAALAPDSNEPDNVAASATEVSCPDTEFLTIDTATDVDFLALSEYPGSTITVDVDAAAFGSGLDSALGIFDSGLSPLATSDDDPAGGEPPTTDSFLSVTVPEDGLLYIAVASSPDLDFDGIGGTTAGPYLVSVDAPGTVVFGQTVLATDKTTFAWTTPANVVWARGDLASVSVYATDDSGFLSLTDSLNDVTPPASGAGFFYLFRPAFTCAFASWQTAADAEPGRDAALP